MAKVVADMNRSGISFDEIMNTVPLKANQRDDVLRCIELAEPEYRVQYRNIDTSHSCKLLQNLTAIKNHQCPVKGVISSMDELRDMMRTQFDMEKRCTTEVKSITEFTGDPNVRQQAVSEFYRINFKICLRIMLIFVIHFNIFQHSNLMSVFKFYLKNLI